MFDFLRNLRKSEEEKRQEALSAYLDGALTPAEKARFEQLLAADEALRASLDEQRLIKASLSRLPRMRAPRNFTLDPARYGQPAPGAAERLYPIMSVATAVVAILFVVALVLDLTPLGDSREAAAPLAELVQSEAEMAEAPAAAAEAPVLESEAQQAAADEVVVEVTRVVEAEEEMVEMAAEEPAAAEMAAEEEAPPPGPEEASGGGAPPGETPMALTAPVGADETAAATEGQALEDRAVAGQPETLAATAEAAAGEAAATVVAAATVIAKATMVAEATAVAEETVVARDMALTNEAASQPAPDAGPAAANQEPTPPEPGAGLRTTQLMALSLGALLIILVAATLLVRRRAR